jgi:hypothetical protein
MEPAEGDGRAGQRVRVVAEGGLILNCAGGDDVPGARTVVGLPDGREIARLQPMTTGVVGPWSIDEPELVEPDARNPGQPHIHKTGIGSPVTDSPQALVAITGRDGDGHGCESADPRRRGQLNISWIGRS